MSWRVNVKVKIFAAVERLERTLQPHCNSLTNIIIHIASDQTLLYDVFSSFIFFGKKGNSLSGSELSSVP